MLTLHNCILQTVKVLWIGCRLICLTKNTRLEFDLSSHQTYFQHCHVFGFESKQFFFILLREALHSIGIVSHVPKNNYLSFLKERYKNF